MIINEILVITMRYQAHSDNIISRMIEKLRFSDKMYHVSALSVARISVWVLDSEHTLHLHKHTSEHQAQSNAHTTSHGNHFNHRRSMALEPAHVHADRRSGSPCCATACLCGSEQTRGKLSGARKIMMSEWSKGSSKVSSVL